MRILRKVPTERFGCLDHRWIPWTLDDPVNVIFRDLLQLLVSFFVLAFGGGGCD
jgi:hypothetical protein